MPHMMPMMWIWVYLSTLTLLLISIILLYFFFIPKMTPVKSKVSKNIKWIWMW